MTEGCLSDQLITRESDQLKGCDGAKSEREDEIYRRA
jgi:hypothetical protein